MANGVKGPKSTKFYPRNHISARHLDLVHEIWTNFGMNIVLDPSNKPEQELFIYRKIPDGCWPMGVKGPKSTKYDTKNHILARHLDLVCQIWMKYGMDILLDPSNKPAQEFLIHRKIQDGRRGSKVQNRPNLTRQIPF